ncbi:MAG: thioredoxin-disulfide reductase [Anaerolineae bacterium]|jgi:thioredoxin reductase (NADPH)|nr:thioredoxin-disulfide reductase [Anaerolineae bacterium]MBT7069347.1 thioredoxin-disulfide reductase [Anaerolineae bacterium]MBT7326529.1 thioredoxin-disulfide reductase [Anaerolineae bacterium]MBT7599736.1 thioredoxin-disulfide reductase [Anaerolineae bacterium]
MFDLNLPNISSSSVDGDEPLKLLVIGSGPAGFSAALYAARAELAPVVLTGMELGGQAALTHEIENYPGFPEGVGGSELGELFQKQAERFGTRTEFDTATEVDFTKSPFEIKTESGEYKAHAVIIATGARPNHLKIPGEEELTGRGVSYCATCDGWFFKEKKVLVVGGGDSALEEALYLTRHATSVTIVHRRDELRAGPILKSRAIENPKIDFVWDSIVTEVVGDEKVASVIIKNVKTGEESAIETDGLFIFIGHTPNTEIFEGQLALDDGGYIVVDGLMQTGVEGVYAAGEVADPHFRQVITSAGMGAGAAIQAVRYMEEKGL